MRYRLLSFLAAGLVVLTVRSVWARIVIDAPATTAPATLPTITRPTARPAPTPPPGVKPTTRASTQPATNASRLQFPTWGIELAPPVGWTRVPEQDFTVMAQWTPSNGSKGMFRVLVTPMLQRSVTAVAEQMAKGLKANLANTTLDGRAARLISGGADGTAAIIAQREGYLVELRYHRNLPKGAPDELEAMRKSWRWTNLESPSSHPEVRPDLIPLTQDVLMQFPVHIRAWPVPPPPKGTVRYAAVDLTRQRIRREFDAEFSMPPAIQGQPLDKLATQLSEPYQAQLVLKKPIGWRLLEGKDDRIISQHIVGPRPDNEPNGPPRFVKCLGLVALDNNRRLLMVFTCVSETEDERFAFMQMAEQIVGSIRTGSLPALAAPGPATAPSASSR